ncbi:MAG: protein-tyrosine phosphatase family protein [Acidimicrobiia bacterium]
MQDAGDATAEPRPVTRFGPLAGPDTVPPRRGSYWVVEGRLVGGAYPYRSDPDEGAELLRRLLGAGVTAFVDLTQAGMAGAMDGHLDAYRGVVASADGVEVVRSPIPDMGVPTAEQAVETLDSIDDLLDRGHTVYVHCWGGIGRTGVMVGAWLLRHGAATNDTVLDVLAGLRAADAVAGHIAAPQSAAQRAFLRSWRG